MRKFAIGSIALVGALNGCSGDITGPSEPDHSLTHGDAGVSSDRNAFNACHIAHVEIGDLHPDARSNVRRVVNLNNLANVPVVMNFEGPNCSAILSHSNLAPINLRIASTDLNTEDAGTPLTERVSRNATIDLSRADRNDLTLTIRLDLRGTFLSANGGLDYGLVSFTLSSRDVGNASDTVDVNTAIPAIAAQERDIPLVSPEWNIVFVNHGSRAGIVRIVDIEPSGGLSPWQSTTGNTMNCALFGTTCATGYSCAPFGPVATPMENRPTRVCTESLYVITVPAGGTFNWQIPTSMRADILRRDSRDRNIEMRYVAANSVGNELPTVRLLQISVEGE